MRHDFIQSEQVREQARTWLAHIVRHFACERTIPPAVRLLHRRLLAGESTIHTPSIEIPTPPRACHELRHAVLEVYGEHRAARMSPVLLAALTRMERAEHEHSQRCALAFALAEAVEVIAFDLEALTSSRVQQALATARLSLLEYGSAPGPDAAQRFESGKKGERS